MGDNRNNSGWFLRVYGVFPCTRKFQGKPFVWLVSLDHKNKLFLPRSERFFASTDFNKEKFHFK